MALRRIGMVGVEGRAMTDATLERAAILWVGTVTTGPDGYSPIVEGWGFDSYDSRRSPIFDHERHTVCGWPIHELAAMAAQQKDAS
jgi:hypothetical protein